MQLLITRADIAQFRQISKTSNDDKLKEMILDAQLLDLQPLIGEKLYNKLIAAPEEYIVLMNGGVYEIDGIGYTNYGLKMVLSYFAYARYIMFSSIIDTPFSVVEKLNADSRPAEISAKKTIYQMNRDSAMQVWGNVKNYLIRTKQPDFRCNSSAPSSRLRFSKIQ